MPVGEEVVYGIEGGAFGRRRRPLRTPHAAATAPVNLAGDVQTAPAGASAHPLLLPASEQHS